MKHILIPIICMGFTACQVLSDDTSQGETRPKKSTGALLPYNQEAPFQKVSQEERDREERYELERKKWRRISETLEAFT